MPYKSPLSRRIIIAFVLLTALVSGLFAYGVYFAVDSVERSLTSAELQREFLVILQDYHDGKNHSLDSGTQFFVGEKGLPEDLRAVAPGWNEIDRQGEGLSVYRHLEGGTSYYLVKKQTEFARHESLIRGIIITGFFISLLAALLLGTLTVKRIIAPVRRLTTQVRRRETLGSEVSPLAAEYPKDEVGDLAGAFDRVYLMLREALQREALFTSDVSHELRTPLMVIKSSCDLLLEIDRLDDYSKDRLTVIGKATEEIQELVTAFLALARDTPLEGKSASLAAIVGGEQAAWDRYALERGHTFAIEDQAPAAAAAAPLYSKILLRAVLNNLVRNAIHHSSQGQVTLILKPAGFALCDNGPGICEADKPLIYQPFYRGMTNEKCGLGLGLSLTARICKHEGWQIALHNNHPTGCCFEVTLQ